MSWILGTTATLTGLAGIASLFYSWRARLPKPLAIRTLGWLLLCLSLAVWVWAQPVEFGVTFALFAPALLAWGLIYVAARHRHPSRDTKLEQRGFQWPKPGAFGYQLLMFVVSVPLAAVASALVTITVTSWLPWEPVNYLVLGVLIAPIVWGAASYWVCADPKLWRPTLTLLVAWLLAAAYLFL